MMHSSTGIQIVVALSVGLLSLNLYVEAGNVQLDYSVTDESRSCANPGELVTFTCMVTGGVLTFHATQFLSDPITFFSFDDVLRTFIRSVGASTFTATLTEVDGGVLTATLTVRASEEVTGTVGCTDDVNTQEANLCLTVPQLVVVPENQLVPFNFGKNVTFQCEVEDGEVVWEINNIQQETPAFLVLDSIFVVDLPPMGRRKRSELRVTVEEGDDRNNTLVRCIGVDAAANTDPSDQVRIITFADPETLHNLQVTLTRENFLFLSWAPPSNLPPGVEITYDVTVVNPDNGTVYPGLPINNIANTFVEFEELETSCQLYEFMVTAENSAGSSNPAVIRETIPISPDVTSVSDSLMATVSFDRADVLLSLTFNPAVSCSTTFGVESYIISLNQESVMEFPDPVNIILSSNETSTLLPDTEYSITVTACSSLTCRQAQPTTAVTTDVQSASVTFVGSDVLLSCELAEGSPARGCVFIFTLNSETERFNVSRNDTVGSQQKRQMDTQAEVCQTTLNLPGAYDSVQVVDWESDGSEGTLPMTVVPQEDPDPDNFVCPDGTADPGSDIGVIVGVVVGTVVLAAIVVLVAVHVVYELRKKKSKATARYVPPPPLGLQEISTSPPEETQETPLHEAADHGSLDTVKFLVDHGTDINIKDDDGRVPLHKAALAGDFDAVKYLVDRGADVNVRDNGGSTPLHKAALLGNLKTVKYLVDHKADVNSKDNHGSTPLHKAALRGNDDAVKFLVVHGADVKSKDNGGSTPLHKAALRGNDDAVKYLVDHGADVKITDKGGRAPLHEAARDGSLDVVKCLVDHGADVNVIDNGGRAPLHKAAVRGNLDAVKYLVDHKADVRIKDNDGETPLHMAALDGDLDTVKHLVDKGADVNSKDNGGETPLDKARTGDHHDVVKYLVDHRVDVTNSGSKRRATIDSASLPPTAVESKSKRRATIDSASLPPTAVESKEDVLEVLKKAIEDNDVNSFHQHLAELERHLQDHDNTVGEELTASGALGYAAKVGSILMMETLIKKGVDVNSVGNSYLVGTPLHYAARNGNLNAVKYLVDYGVDVNIKTNGGRAPLHKAALHGNVDTVRYLVDHGADVKSKDNHGRAPLHYAALHGNLDTVIYLTVDHKADVNIKDNDGRAPLYYAARDGHLDTVKYLVDHGADVKSKDKGGRVPLHEAARDGNLDAVKYLVGHGADVKSKDNGGRTPLYEAVCDGYLDTVKYLVDRGADVKSKDKGGETALDKAAASDHHDVVEYLVDRGADVKIQTNSGEDVLEVLKKAIQDNDVGTFHQHLAELERLLHNTVGEQLTASGALGYAAKVGSILMMETLIKKGVDVNAVLAIEIEGISYLGSTTLHLAATDGNLDTVKCLVGHGADVDIKNNKGRTPLHHAAFQGNLDTVKYLVDHGAGVNIKNNDGETPLHNATYRGNLHTAKHLVDHGADVNTKDNREATPLHNAVLDGNLDLVYYLVDLGVDVNLKDNRGETPLHWAALHGKNTAAAVKYLVDHRADVNIRNNVGRAPLHNAADHGNLEAVKHLVDHEADVNIKDNGGETPLDKAAAANHRDVVKYLTEQRGDVSIKKNGNKPTARHAPPQPLELQELSGSDTAPP